MSFCPAVAGTFSYVGLGNQTQEISISPDIGKVTIGHRGADARFCDSGEFLCFKSDELAFAVPRTFSQTAHRSRWTYDGQQFVASASAEDIRIIGNKLQVFFIDVPAASPPMRYWYDTERGVVAIQKLSPNSPVLLLTQECGFGAPPSCLRHPAQK
jgi:hypothetical protein